MRVVANLITRPCLTPINFGERRGCGCRELRVSGRHAIAKVAPKRNSGSITRVERPLSNQRMPGKKPARKKSRLREAETEWTWNKRYRVWDASRKIFLYPENWIEPDLRSSPLSRAALQKIVAFVCKWRKQDGGSCVLFTGKNRVGVLLAAQTLARDLEKDLYRIDLSAVVSEYIGETEKNLRRIFDSAKSSSAILFFDEADALFGKRTRVKDSHDRYADIETNYLLQRLESHRGLSILATGRRSNVDEAFLRRFHFVISIPFRRKGRRRKSSAR